MLNRTLVGVLGVAGAMVFGAPGFAAADPPPAPNINAFPSERPSEYAVQDGAWYAFTVPGGVTRGSRFHRTTDCIHATAALIASSKLRATARISSGL